MPRHKKRMTIIDLENHVIDWWIDYIHHERNIVNEILADRSIPEDEREFIFAGIANSLADVQLLVEPLKHEEEDLQAWVNEFLEDYQDISYDVRYEN